MRVPGPLLGIVAAVSLMRGAGVTPSVQPTLTQEAGTHRVSFSGYEWTVKSSRRPVGPGPNVFRHENVHVDSHGRLHLAIVRVGDTWTSAEIGSRERFGYGTYRFTVADVPEDPRAILGLFTWEDEPSDPFRREIDIEIGRWGNPDHPNAQCVVQPSRRPGHMVRFNVPVAPAVHEFTWTRQDVACSSRLARQPDESVAEPSLQRFVLTASPPAGAANVRINLWLAGGRPPSQEDVLHAIVEGFEFVPAR